MFGSKTVYVAQTFYDGEYGDVIGIYGKLEAARAGATAYTGYDASDSDDDGETFVVTPYTVE